MSVINKVSKEWQVAVETPAVIDISNLLDISRASAQLLVNRGIRDKDSAEKFLKSKRSHIHLPELLPDLIQAVIRIKRAVQSKEKIILFGDYDVDGVTSLAMMSDYLSKLGVPFNVLIPSRINHGYGFNQRAIDFARKEKASLIITLDCGTNSSLVNQTKKYNIDTIVVDHHEVIPKERNYLLVNPKRQDSSYPFRDVSTGLLAFKLIWALRGEFPYEYIDLATLSIVCDVMPLLDENRAFVKEGLIKLRDDPCLGVDSLIKATSVKRKYIKSFHLGWILGPRLNASGRLSCAYPSWKLLSTGSHKKAKKLADFLNKINNERKDQGKKVFDSAMDKLNKEIDTKNDYVFVLSGEDWHVGILGIAASRIKERFFRPTFLISLEDNIGKGSGRSVEKFHLMDALNLCKDSLIGYGGHQKACGIEIKKSKIKDFSLSLNEYAKNILSEEDLVPKLFIERELDFKELTQDFLEIIDLFAPYGEGNPEPLFVTKNLSVRNVTNDKWGNKLVWFSENKEGQNNFTYPAQVRVSNKLFSLMDYAESFDIVYKVRPKGRNYITPLILRIEDVRIS